MGGESTMGEAPKDGTMTELQTDNPEIIELTDFLVKKQKEVSGWKIEKPIGNGANGVVLSVTKGSEKAVMKVALNQYASTSMEWETSVMKHILEPKWKDDRTRHLVRMLDYGRTKNNNGEDVSFTVMEMVPGNPVTAIANEKTPSGVIDKVCEFGLQLLKALYDLHSCGLIHRDIKPENVGMYKDKLLVMYDLGMARIFTAENGNLRTVRSYVGMRGTDEWANVDAEMGRDQSRVDDLWGFFYCLIEWCNCKSAKPLAWADYDSIPDLRHLMKTSIFPARVVLANCPTQFFAIHFYLRSINNDVTPDYFYIAQLLKEAKSDFRRKVPHMIDPKTFLRRQRILENQF
ncbi:hypothetical protein PRIPAC_84510 [Pristionchus pacificus]|uniref:Protein kinase domain-containing protein n=1 Tax=Pristionchus pacificus TaxID=54126 RepID=A0A2A6BLM6_PRIPA|nr:hypothetical protein PRIPAC_84510 [Pristionchus pacificus]|eukprot:PDM66815.1 protein kinase [Pristionchus pacificus]